MFIHLFLYIDDIVFLADARLRSWLPRVCWIKAKGNVLGMEIVRDHSGNTLRVSQSRFYNGKLVQTLLEGHFILSLEGSLSEDCDVEKNDKRTSLVDSDYVMGRSITRVYDTYSGCKGGYLAKGTRNRVRIVAGIATGALSKVVPISRFQHRLKLLRIEDF
ncbi:hypothetical protein Tco_0987772 [Tanacetum coccineum]